MPNQPRKYEVGGIYHVFNRGYEKRNIFLDDSDYTRFIESLYYFNNKKITKIKTARLANPGLTGKRDTIVELLAFTLMPNHYHLIVRETIDEGISAFMQKLGNGYIGYFNERHKRSGSGSIFQSRYKSVSVQDDIQLGVVFSYVHTNPIVLKEPAWRDFKIRNARNAIRWLENYRWSSYRDYIGYSNFPKVVQSDFFTEFYGNKNACHQAVEDWITFKARKTVLGPEIIE